MEYFFDNPLNQIVDLILEQRELAEAYERRVKVSCSWCPGSLYSRNPEYLHDRWLRRIETFARQADSSYETMENHNLAARYIASGTRTIVTSANTLSRWTAVVRGAAIHGIEKGRSKKYIRTDCSPHSYGIAHDQELAKGMEDEKHQTVSSVTGKLMGIQRMVWIVRRNDLVLLSTDEAPETLLEFTFTERDDKVFVIPVYQYLEDDDDNLPVRLKGAAKGESYSALNKVTSLTISRNGQEA